MGRKTVFGIFLGCIALAGLQPGARAAETDQYLAWGVVLECSADAFNEYLNEELEALLERMNRRTAPVEACEEIPVELYFYMFNGLHFSRVRNFFRDEATDHFPNERVSNFAYQRMSIYRGWAFPYLLPMARTVRVGEVHLGIDKMNHFFGFGRRYYQRYLRHKENDGMPRREAEETVVRWGISLEQSLVGKLVDGVFSHADVEANWQGFRMARNLCDGPGAYIARENGRWVLTRPIEIRDYVTPGFDESYNSSQYWAGRKRNVLPLKPEEHCHRRCLPCVRERFAYYDQYPLSFSQQIVNQYFEERDEGNKQYEHSLDYLCKDWADLCENPARSAWIAAGRSEAHE